MTKKIAAVNNNSCDRSPFCPSARVCPQKAIVSLGKSTGIIGLFGLNNSGYTVEKDKCTGCGVCVQYCAMGAINMVGA